MSIYSAILTLVLALAPGLAHAGVALELIDEGVLDALPIDLYEGDIPCDQIQARLAAYNQMAAQHDSQLTGYLYQVAGSLAQWHSALEPLASAQCPEVPVAGFENLAQTSAQIDSRAHMAALNSTFLAEILNPVVALIPACLSSAVSVTAASQLTCDQISDLFIDYSGKLLLHESADNSFMGDVSRRLNEIYETLSQYDCAELQDGTLMVLPDAANKVDSLANTAYDNAEKLANEFDRISVSLSSCQ